MEAKKPMTWAITVPRNIIKMFFKKAEIGFCKTLIVKVGFSQK